MPKLPFEFDASQYPVDEPRSTPTPAPATPQDADFPIMFPDPAPATPAPVAPNEIDPNDPWNAPQPQPAPTKSRFVPCHINEQGVLVIDSIPDGYTQEEADILTEWYPQLYGKPSTHIDNPSGVVINGEDVLKHVAGISKQLRKEEEAKAREERAEERKQQEEVRSRYSKAYAEWEQACRDRKQRIDASNAKWRQAVADKRQAVLQWDAYIAQLRADLQTAKTEPVPSRPNKKDFE